MEKVFIDTSGWVALFSKNDVNNEHAVNVFGMINMKNIEIYTSDYVVDETITTIRMRSDHKSSVVAGKALLDSELIRIVNVAPDYLPGTWKMYQKYKDKRFSFTDVSCFNIMKDLGIKKLLSFDREFAQAGIVLM